MSADNLYETFENNPERYELVDIDINSRFYDKYYVYELFNQKEGFPIQPKKKLYCKIMVKRDDHTVTRKKFYYEY